MELQSGHKDAGANDMTRFLRILQAGQFADFKITCQGHTWQAHKVILAARSDFFRAAICGQFTEAENSHIDLPEDEPTIIARLLLHMYSDEYPEMPLNDLKLQSSTFSTEPEQSAQNENEELFHKLDLAVDLFAAGVKFGVSTIQPQACKGARRAYMEHWKQAVREDSSRYWQIVQKAYTTTPESFFALRHTILEAILCCSDVAKSHRSLQLLRDVPDFAYDMAVCTTTKSWKCQACKEPIRTLIKPCECPCVGQVCSKDACIKKYVEDSICWSCDGHGTVAPRGFQNIKTSTNTP